MSTYAVPQARLDLERRQAERVDAIIALRSSPNVPWTLPRTEATLTIDTHGDPVSRTVAGGCTLHVNTVGVYVDACLASADRTSVDFTGSLVGSMVAGQHLSVPPSSIISFTPTGRLTTALLTFTPIDKPLPPPGVVQLTGSNPTWTMTVPAARPHAYELDTTYGAVSVRHPGTTFTTGKFDGTISGTVDFNATTVIPAGHRVRFSSVGDELLTLDVQWVSS